MGHLTSSLLKSTPLIIVLLLGFPAAISADDEPHDWSECTKIGEGLSIKSDSKSRSFVLRPDHLTSLTNISRGDPDP